MEKSRRQSSRLKKNAVLGVSVESAERIIPPKNLKSKSIIKPPIAPHRYGDIIIVDETNLSGVITQPIIPKKRRKETGTEEILGDIIEPVDIPSVVKTPEPIPIKKNVIRQKRHSPAFEDFSEPESPPMHTTKRAHIHQILSESEDEVESTSELIGYKSVWEEALKEKPSTTTSEEDSERRPSLLIAFPEPQPTHFSNRFANKNLLSEPTFPPLRNRGPMMFSTVTVNKQFNGTDACSKVAGNILGDIIAKKKKFNGLFSMQIPNSLRVFNNDNANEIKDEDIQLEKQNTSHKNKDVETSFYQKQRGFDKPLALEGFSNSQPFGKLLLLKSGKIVLQVGTRRFDVVSTSPNHSHQAGIIMDFSGVTQIKPPSFLQPNKMALHSIGRIEHFFSAFYNYSKILETLPPQTSLLSKSQKAHAEEVDLTIDQCQENLKEIEEEKNVNDMLKRKTTMKRRTKSTTTQNLAVARKETTKRKKKMVKSVIVEIKKVMIPSLPLRRSRKSKLPK